jgi:hypothetical protein
MMRSARLAPLALVAFLVGGCQDFLDVNEDPNAPVNARVDVRLPAVITGMVHSVYYGDPPLWTVEWMQQTSFNRTTRNYDELHLYEVQDNSPNEWWSFYYAGILNETKLMMQETNPETEAAYHGIARFIAAWTWATTTDLWGPIPFAEALNPAVPTPSYDDQQAVYDAVDQWFEEAVSEMKRAAADASIRRPGANDLLFEGDMLRWVKLARHVQARHRLRLTNASWANAQEQAQAALTALQEGLASNADDADFEHTGETTGRNPLWLFQDEGEIFKVSQLTVSMLQERTDPRLPIMVDPALSDGAYRGHGNAAAPEPDSSISQVGVFFTAEDAPVNVASYAEAKFIEAEARFIVSGAAAADAPYREAIRANMEKSGVASAAIDVYLAALPPLASVANPLEEIIREKYIANYLKVEPWHDWRRTGFPQIQPVPGAFLSGIPVRIRTPASELANNDAHVRATGIDPGLDGMLYKGTNVWWGGN